MRTIHYILVLSIAAICTSCGGSNTKTDNNSEKTNESKTEATDPTASDATKIYTVKSGHFLCNTNMGMTIETWFDDYGNKQYSESMMELFGEKTGSYSYVIDGYKYDYSTGETEGSKMKFYGAQSYNYDDVSQKDIERYGLEFHADEVVSGKTCKVISITSPVETKVWIWEGIPMKTITKMGKEDIVMEIEFLETGNVDASKFVLPDSINFVEY